MNHRQACEDYLMARTGCYEWRCERYLAVAQKLGDMGLSNHDIVVDVGAGWTEFDYFLRKEFDWRGRYLPIDGSLDGVDLNVWEPPFDYDFFVAIEILEHLYAPWRLATLMSNHARKGVIVTTPNPETTDVLGMDPTHKTPMPEWTFHTRGWETSIESFYGKEKDSILAWRKI